MPNAREGWFFIFSIIFYSLIIGFEIIASNYQHKKYYTLKETLQNVYLTLSNAGLDVVLRTLFYLSILTWSFNHRFFQFDNAIVYWLMLFVLEDLAFYVEHRVDHYCRLFWAVHVTHHSSPEFNITTGFRSSVLQPVYRFIYFIPIAMLGFKPMDIVFMYALTQTYGIVVHTQFINKMPSWFEAVFVSPSHHRVHHASNIIYLDKNMGMCLIIWDKLFGTFQKELPEEPIVYGLTKPIAQPHHPYKVVFHEWHSIGHDLRKSKSLLIKLKYLFMPPGWSHDGSSETASAMRKKLEK